MKKLALFHQKVKIEMLKRINSAVTSNCWWWEEVDAEIEIQQRRGSDVEVAKCCGVRRTVTRAWESSTYVSGEIKEKFDMIAIMNMTQCEYVCVSNYLSPSSFIFSSVFSLASIKKWKKSNYLHVQVCLTHLEWCKLWAINLIKILSSSSHHHSAATRQPNGSQREYVVNERNVRMRKDNTRHSTRWGNIDKGQWTMALWQHQKHSCNQSDTESETDVLTTHSHV